MQELQPMHDATGESTPRTGESVLLLSTIHATLAGRSGYQVLADYLPGAEFIHSPRQDPSAAIPWFFARSISRLSLTRYYLGGSASLEWKAWRRIRQGFKGVVHMMWADHDLGFLDLVPLGAAVPLIGTFHLCSDAIGKTIRFPSRLRRLKALILMSESQRPYFLSAGVDPSRIHVVLHGVDTDYFTSPSDRPFDVVTVLAVGNTRRNFPLLRQVCMEFRHDPRIRFRIVAAPDRRAMFADLPNVDFRCGLSDEQLLTSYREANILIQTLENSTANNVLLEAMSCGLPVVAERVGGIGEYASADNAILTTPNDVTALTTAVRRLVESPNARVEMGLAARQRAEKLSWPKTAELTRAVYRHAATAGDRKESM
jgi:glycosyltransferase involved in cell wall biosynthesis